MSSKAPVTLAVALCGVICSLPTTAQGPGDVASSASSHRALLDRYCVLCHNETLKTASLMLDTVDVENASKNPEIWEKVVRKLRTESMPPVGMPRPDTADYESLAGYLEGQLDAAADRSPNPGRPSAVHRLNRAEYTNAVRDLLALEVDGSALLPADEAGAGFDNNGNILSVSAMLMERYLIAARQISRTAVGDPTLRPVTATFDAPRTGLQRDRESEDLPFGSRGGMAVRYAFPLDGEYRVKIRLQRTSGIEGPRILGLGEPHELDLRLDRQRIKLFTIGGERDLRPDEVEDSLVASFTAAAGTRVLGVTFLDEDLAPAGMLRPLHAEMHLDGWGPRSDSRRPPGVESISISGPYNAGKTTTGPGRRIFVCYPAEARNEIPCARQILSHLARRAYRRPVASSDVDSLMSYYEAGRKSYEPGKGNGSSFDEGIRMALEAILVSPDFLFRVEMDPPTADQEVYRVSDIELASRLSFFLWSSIPDEELLDLAEAGKLKDASVLEQQVQRMVLDSRSHALVDNFFGQWLAVRRVKSHTADTVAFPYFDDDLREAFQREAELFLASVVREDRSVLDLLNADYTYVNERLAQHYGIPGVYGSRFRRVTLTDENRWGILGKGFTQLVTSLPNRTSPVLRGAWALDNVMGAPPPPPPPNVPAFPENDDTDFTRLTVRERLEKHRANPFCATCHSRMDPLGFAFENFDAVGKWRTREANPITASPEFPVVFNAIDSSGSLPGGTRFQGVSDLRGLLMRKPENFAHVVTERLLTYALGRGLDYYDARAVRRIVSEAAPDDFRWSSIVLGIVKSAPFRMRAPTPSQPDSLRSEPQLTTADSR